MGKVVKGLLYLLGALLSLIIILLIAIPLFVDPNDYRDEIGGIVKKETGRALTINGEIQLSLFPWIGIELGEMQLSNAPGFGDSPFAQVKKVDVKIKLMPLLRKQVEMDTIILHGMSLNLAKNTKGISNWDDLAKPASAPAAQQGPKTAITKPTQSKENASLSETLAALAIGGVEIRDANISWHDKSLQQKIEINRFNLISGAISLDSEFPLDINFSTSVNSGGDAAPMAGDITLKSMIGINIDQQQYRLSKLLLTTNLKSAQLPNGKLDSTFAGNFSADLKQQTARADGLTIKVLGTVLTLNSDITHLDKSPQVKGDIQLDVAQATALMSLAGNALPPTITSKMLESTALSAHIDLNTEKQTVALEKFKLGFDQSLIKGSASVTNFDKPAIRYQFDINQFNVDRYFPPATGKSNENVVAEQKASSSTSEQEVPIPIPVELIRTLDIDGTLRLGALQVMNLHTSKMVATVKAKDGKLALAPLSAELYQGKFNGSIKLDVSKKVPVVHVKEKLTGVQSAPLLKDLLGKDYISGGALLTADIHTKGDRISLFKKNLNGHAEVRFEDGAINGVDIAQLIREAYASYKGIPVEKSAGKPKTDFALLSATLNIKNGLVTNKDLNAQSPLLRVGGKGQANIVTEKVDYHVKASLVNTLEGQGGKTLSDLKGLTIPVSIKGSFSDPKFGVELDKLLDAQAKAKVDAARAKAQARLEAARAKAQKQAQDKLNAEKERLKKDLQKNLLKQFKFKF